MSGYIDSVLPAQTQPKVYTKILDEHRTNRVPVSSWKSLVNVGLSLTQYVSEAFATSLTLARQVFRGMFVDSVQEDVATAPDAATLARVTAAADAFALSQYQEAAQPATLAVLRVEMTSVSTAAVFDFAAGTAIAGTPSTSSSLLYAIDENIRLVPGGRVVALFKAQSPGSTYNLASDSAFELKTTFTGVSVAVPSSGERYTFGTGSSSLAVHAGANLTNSGLPLKLGLRVTGPSVSVTTLTFIGPSGGYYQVYVDLRSDSGSAPLATADEVRSTIIGATSRDMFAGAQFPDGTDGTGVMVVAALTILPSADGPIEDAGQDAEAPLPLITRCVSKWDALEVGAGTGDALYYWGTKAPAGYTASPVAQIQVLNARKSDGTTKGGWVTVLVSGLLGPLSVADLAAVDGNFYSPRKFAAFAKLATINATTHTITVTAAVQYLKSSKLQNSDISAAIAAALLNLQQRLTMGVQTIDPSLVEATVGTANPAIWKIALTVPGAPVTLLWNERAAFSMSGFTYAQVDP